MIVAVPPCRGPFREVAFAVVDVEEAEGRDIGLAVVDVADLVAWHGVAY